MFEQRVQSLSKMQKRIVHREKTKREREGKRERERERVNAELQLFWYRREENKKEKKEVMDGFLFERGHEPGRRQTEETKSEANGKNKKVEGERTVLQVRRKCEGIG